MNLKNKSYMQEAEFKERQSFFSFFCEQAFEFLKSFKANCLKGWKNLMRTNRNETFENRTLDLPFEKLTHREWQEKTQQVYLKLVNS
ncbi:MAG: hypothetical protein WCI39_07000 [Gallionellaceae bacterium]